MEDEKCVYHGSPTRSFEIVTPKRNIRKGISKDNGEMVTIFDDISFHATPYKWIALAYTYLSKPYEIDGKTAHYNMGVSLYTHEKKLRIYGFESLEKSLEKLYGGGGYLYLFDKNKFFHTEGLGHLEVITKESIKPISIERIDNPVKELRELGVEFEYIDLSKPENEDARNYY